MNKEKFNEEYYKCVDTLKISNKLAGYMWDIIHSKCKNKLHRFINTDIIDIATSHVYELVDEKVYTILNEGKELKNP